MTASRTYIVRPQIKVLVRGEYMLETISVLYVPVTALNSDGASFERVYGCHLYSCGSIASKLFRRSAMRRITRDVARIRNCGARVVDQDGDPFVPARVTWPGSRCQVSTSGTQSYSSTFSLASLPWRCWSGPATHCVLFDALVGSGICAMGTGAVWR